MSEPRCCRGPFASVDEEMRHIAFHAYIETRTKLPSWQDAPDERDETAWDRLQRLVGR